MRQAAGKKNVEYIKKLSNEYSLPDNHFRNLDTLLLQITCPCLTEIPKSPGMPFLYEKNEANQGLIEQLRSDESLIFDNTPLCNISYFFQNRVDFFIGKNFHEYKLEDYISICISLSMGKNLKIGNDEENKSKDDLKEKTDKIKNYSKDFFIRGIRTNQLRSKFEPKHNELINELLNYYNPIISFQALPIKQEADPRIEYMKQKTLKMLELLQTLPK